MSIEVPAGFRLSGIHCGIKASPRLEDLTLVVCEPQSVAAGMYTQNLFFAAPVEWDRALTPLDDVRAVVVNSGNANACTGQRGTDDARRMAELTAEACDAEPRQVLVMSTGVIGVHLPMDRIAAGITRAAGSLDRSESAFLAAARGITTTDKSHKVAGRRLELGPRRVCLSGMAKGAGMIGPRMATLLGLVLTDAPLAPAAAQAALSAAVEDSFNCISVEGHMSTNDTVLLLASGRAGGPALAGAELQAFETALRELCVELARMIPDDGEGATHLITIDIEGCQSREAARQIAQTVANSALVKTAVAGGDPNWGRIVSATGYAGVPFNAGGVDLDLNGRALYRRGAPVEFDETEVSRSIREQRETHIRLRFSEGSARIRFWTSDLTTDYVEFNADYRT